MTESFNVALVDLKEWLERETEPIVKPLRDRGEKLLDEIKDRLDDVKEQGDRLFAKSDKEAQKGSAKTYRCAKAANKMSKNISDIINRIAVPDNVSTENIQSLAEDLEKSFATIDQERRKWYRRISPYFILDRRRLDISIKRTEDSIQQFRSFLLSEYVDVETARNLADDIDKLSRLLENAEKIQRSTNKLKTRLELNDEKIHEENQKVSLITDKTELDELAELEQQIVELKAKVKYNLRHLRKPFYKMLGLTRRSQVALPPDETRKLKQYMSNPFEALVSEEHGHPILKRILQKLDDLMRRGRLKLKTTRLKKAQEQMDGILNKNSLFNLHQDCLAVLSRKRQLSASQTVTSTHRELNKLQETIQNLQDQKESLSSKRKTLGEKHQRVLRKIQIQREELEKSVFELIDKRIQVVLAKVKDVSTTSPQY
ncbi:MAG: hypothetical protein NWE77_03300 [Candidatus Bathyarchaeota archaeon]|jgi:chromosome segregation ATPase|nr:hypothetical protein [Candidatus Bathyarchaeota archaeon]